MNQHGNQMLICPLGYKYGYDKTSKNGSSWRCYSTLYKDGHKRIQCTVRVHTMVINGYEMIDLVKRHKHPPPEKQKKNGSYIKLKQSD